MGQWPTCTVLGAMNPEDREDLLSLGTRREFQPGMLLVHEGDWTTDAFVLLDGFVKVTGSGADGHVVLLSIRTGGDIIGELAALDGQARSASAQAATVVTALAVGQRAFLSFLARRPAAALLVHRSIAAKLRLATRHRIDVGGARLVIRIARVIDNLAGSYGTEGADGLQIEVPLSQTDLASLVGAAEPSVQRELSRLRREKILQTGYRRILVIDPAGLRTLAAGAG